MAALYCNTARYSKQFGHISCDVSGAECGLSLPPRSPRVLRPREMGRRRRLQQADKRVASRTEFTEVGMCSKSR